MEGLTIKKRFNSLVEDRKILDDTFQVIEKMVVPFRGEFFKPMTNEAEVDWRKREIFDSTAILANQQLAASLQSNLTNPSSGWFSLGFRGDKLEGDQEAKEWLEACEDIIYQDLQDSNFNLESNEFYLDLTSYGTSILIEEVANEIEWEGIEFTAAPLVDIYFEEDRNGQIKRMYRRINWLPLQIMDKFGADKVPEWVKEADIAASNTKIEMVYCIYFRESKKDANVSKKLAPKERPFGSKYIFHKDGSEIGEEGGKYEMPAFAARWRKVSGSRWGHSPAFVCLSDILTLNALTEETLEALGKVVDPSTIVTERGLLSDLDLGRGGLTVARSKDDIWAYESRARFDVGELKIDRLQNAVRSAFFIDQLEVQSNDSDTAFEFGKRYEMMQRLLGPSLGRIISDYLDPMIQRTFNIEARAGRLPEPPQSVQDAEAEYDIRYIGPLPRAQRMQVVDSINQYLGGMAARAEIFPDALDIPDIDAMEREIAELSGVPAKLLNNQKDIDDVREARAEQAQAAAEAQLAEQEGKGMKAIGEGVAANNGGQVQ